jgi:glycosyltransferase involved in cell wall biosynthesis
MKLSIITVVFNNEKTIKDAIESVLKQTYENIEYVVIDGNSSDKTVSIIREYENKLGFFNSEKDNGIYDAMNKGILVANGDVIGILNSDDLYQDDTVIQTVMNQFLQNPTLDIVYGDLVYVRSDDVNKIVRHWKSYSYYNSFFENGNVPPHPSLFVRRSVYQKAGLFDLDFKLAADYEFMLRIFKKYNFNSKYINRVIVKMRLGGATNQSFLNIKRQNIEILNAWKKNSLRIPILLMPLRLIKRLGQFMK